MSGCRPRRPGAARRRADESGGAVSLWVVLMVPVSAFAAVVAMAGPQRMAAESSMDEAADDLATLAVAWRDGHGTDAGPLPAFPPDCQRSDEQAQKLAALAADEGRRRDARDAARVDRDAAIVDRDAAIVATPFDRDALVTAEDALVTAEDVLTAAQDALDEHDEYRDRLRLWEDRCEEMFSWIVRDLGYLGVDVNSLEGFYSDSLTHANSPVNINRKALPCRISPKVEVLDAVHVSLVADWTYAGWAAAQVWPDGTRMGAESIGRMRRSVDNSDRPEECKQNLDVLDSEGRAVVLDNPMPNDEPSRKLTQSVPGRTTIGG